MKIIFAFLLLLLCTKVAGQEIAWFPVKDGLFTPWGESIKPENVHDEYPRPSMVRKDWKNLNGIWEFTIQEKEKEKPVKYDRQILVPFAPESALSGLKANISPSQKIWYRRHFFIPENWSYRYILLHIGASDWETTVYVNGQNAGTHRGGYDPITLDITFFLKEKGRQKIEIEVWDPTNTHFQPVGKQKLDPKGIWYTPVSGIWQTVWIEPVMRASIKSIDVNTDVDRSSVSIKANAFQTIEKDSIICSIYDGKNIIQEQKSAAGAGFNINLEKPKLWSPETPHLYDFTLKLVRDNKTIDSVSSYFGMRKIAVEEDKNGVKRFFLNNKPIFMMGLLDQGFWPEGLYTAPSDEALEKDISLIKSMGYNALRKHVKVESERWYYHCDKLGILVWQDMPNGDKHAKWEPPSGKDLQEIERSFASASQYKIEFEAVYNANKHHPCIVTWVPFNEGWGQFNTLEITQWVKQLDSTRLVDGPSGGNFFPVGDIRDFHHYAVPALPAKDNERVVVLSEYGGLGLPIKDHTLLAENNWGYRNLTSKKDLTQQYVTFIGKLKDLTKEGLSAAFYTQLSDVENEVNGIITYDRRVLKLDEKKAKKAHEDLFQYFREIAKD